MKKTSLMLFLVFSIGSGFIQLISCADAGNKKSYADTENNTYNIEGIWKGNISSPYVQGIEILQLGRDSIITITDSISYTAHNSKFETSMNAVVHNQGKWYISRDSLIASLEGASISLDTTSFVLKMTASIDSATIIRDDDIRSEFRAAIAAELKGMFLAGVIYRGSLGKIVMPAHNSISLMKEGSEMVYNRMKD